MSFAHAASEFARSAHRLVELDDDDDAEDTGIGIQALTPQAAKRVLASAVSRSGGHMLQIPTCEHVKAREPACEACTRKLTRESSQTVSKPPIPPPIPREDSPDDASARRQSAFPWPKKRPSR